MLQVGPKALRQATVPRLRACFQRFQGLHGAAKPPLVLVLDVDETLWRSHVPGVHRTNKDFEHDFKVELHLDENGETPTSTTEPASSSDGPSPGAVGSHHKEIRVALRPGLDNFFEWIRRRRSEGVIEGPWIFTQGSTVYLDAVKAKVDPTGDIFGDRILCRGACTPLQRPWPWVKKDMTKVPCGEDGGAHPERAILVENNPMSGLGHPNCLLMVHDWVGGNKFDRELKRVMATLDAVLDDTTGEPGDYARTLRDITPGHGDFAKDLEHLHECVSVAPPKGKTANQAIKEVWIKAVKAKTRLIEQQPRRKPRDSGK